MKDRGLIKWTAMMLPEHVQLLREWEKEDEKVTMPLLDDQALERYNDVVQEAVAKKRLVAITYLQDGIKQQLTGTIARLMPLEGRLDVRTKTGVDYRLLVGTILAIEML